MDTATSRQVVLECVRKQVEQATGSKSVSMFPTSAPACIPALTSLKEGLGSDLQVRQTLSSQVVLGNRVLLL